MSHSSDIDPSRLNLEERFVEAVDYIPYICRFSPRERQAQTKYHPYLYTSGGTCITDVRFMHIFPCFMVDLFSIDIFSGPLPCTGTMIFLVRFLFG